MPMHGRRFWQVVAYVDQAPLAPGGAQRGPQVVAVDAPGGCRPPGPEACAALGGPQVEDAPAGPVVAGGGNRRGGGPGAGGGPFRPGYIGRLSPPRRPDRALPPSP